MARLAAAAYLVAAGGEVIMALWIFPRSLVWLSGLAVLTGLGYRRARAARRRSETDPRATCRRTL